MAGRLAGKVALVTGSSRGIGRGIALRLAQEGADVAVNYSRSAKEAQEVAEQITAMGRKAIVVKADMAKVADVRMLVGEAIKQLGGLDILVNNAGVEKRVPFVDVTEEEYDFVLDVNLKGSFFAAQAAARHMIAAKKGGRIINISSVHEEIPFPGFADYCASKGALKMLCRDLAVVLGPNGITVNNVSPGAINTAMNHASTGDPVARAALIAQIPLGRVGEVEEVAGVVAFLASDEARYVTASSYFVDGGLTWFYKE